MQKASWHGGCDAITVNPLMGSDVLDALLKREKNAFGFALCLTSNPSARDFFLERAWQKQWQPW